MCSLLLVLVLGPLGQWRKEIHVFMLIYVYINKRIYEESKSERKKENQAAVCLLSAHCGVLCCPEAFPASCFTVWATREAPLCFHVTPLPRHCGRHRRTVHHEPSNSPSSFLFIYSKLIYFGPHDLLDPSSPTRGWTHSLGQWKLRVLTSEPPGNFQLFWWHGSHHPSLVFVVSLCSF